MEVPRVALLCFVRGSVRANVSPCPTHTHTFLRLEIGGDVLKGCMKDNKEKSVIVVVIFLHLPECIFNLKGDTCVFVRQMTEH